MSSQLNAAKPLVMHVDLNSCFASIEQQSRPLLRGRPVAVVNRRAKNTAVVTASYEAKRHGVKTGMRLAEARALCPGLVALESDPPKYRYVYRQLMRILNDYSADVDMKSIDEGVVDFSQSSRLIVSRGLVDIGQEIKQRLRDEVGIWMRCNVGIGPNRFLAKTAAGLNKPDGLDVISHQNLYHIYASLELTDLAGIAKRNQARLNAVGIHTPLDFLAASEETLQRIVFKSIDGSKWYKRLRGWEVDNKPTQLGQVGRQYVLERFDLTQEEVLQRLHHLCESVGWRLRQQGLAARGVYVYAKTAGGRWQARRMTTWSFFSDATIYQLAAELFRGAPSGSTEIGIHCYGLTRGDTSQLSLIVDDIEHDRAVSRVTDDINIRYGERTITSADTVGTGMYVGQKIPFGSTRYI